jgi:hypothetical protein
MNWETKSARAGQTRFPSGRYFFSENSLISFVWSVNWNRNIPLGLDALYKRQPFLLNLNGVIQNHEISCLSIFFSTKSY